MDDIITDTDLLNWLATHPHGANIVVDGVPQPCVFWGVSGSPDITLREAIKLVMQQERADG